jgi:poly-gamma-glutamate synthesis protein (capsule biosynthesis protein)
MAEREFSVADKTSPGANPYDLICFVNAIHRYKQEGIFVVLIHGGKEHYPYPTPEMVRKCRFMVDMGADAVICCHTHCPLPWEIYADRPIVYGLGNLIFESTGEMPAGWHEGYLATLTIDEGKIHLGVVPYVQSLANLGAHKMDENRRKHFFDEMEIKAAEVKDGKCLEERWVEYCRRQKKIYLTGLFGYNRFMRKAYSLLFRRLHAKKEVLNALHLVQCETHQEILNTIFKDERQESDK